MKRLAFGTALLLLGLGGGPARAAPFLIHDYELNNSLTDSLGGPALVPGSGTLGPTGYTFPAGQGLSLSNWLAGSASAGNYSIEMRVTLDQISGYRRLIEFKNLTSDNGLYNFSGDLNFYSFASGNTAPISDGTSFDVVLTRDGGTGQTVGYVNGVQQFTFLDSTNAGVFSGPSNIIYFVTDNTSGSGQGENASGFLDRIRIYDGVLSADQVSNPPGPAPGSAVPEPASMSLLALGAVGMVGYRLRRRTAGAGAPSEA